MGRKIAGARFDALLFGDDPWRLAAEGAAMAAPQLAAVFTIGNGFIGVRGPGDAPGAARVYLNGVYERVPIAYHEAAYGYARESDTRLAVADATRPEIRIDGAVLGAPARIELDLRRGTRAEYWHIRSAGEEAVVEVTTLAAFARAGLVCARITFPAVLASRISVRAHVSPPPGAALEAEEQGAAGPAEAEAVYDPRLAPGFARSPWCETEIVEDGRVDMLARSGTAVAALACLSDGGAVDGRCVIDLFAAYAADSAGSPLHAARGLRDDARATGFDTLAEEQHQWLAGHWRQSQIGFDADARATQAVRHGLFQLVQAAGRDGRCSVAAKGQSGEGYEGHVFWDADLYVLPVFAFTQPDVARAMLVWRIAALDAARDNARAMGQARGALYPWRTIGGHECSSFFPAGSAQYHINADIGFALETYVAASGDRGILAEGGAEMLVETARIWLEIGFHDPARGAFVINRVTGPDEYSAIVDNNLYTNLMARRHLRFAAREGLAAGLIDDAEAAKMHRAADAMLLPFDSARGIYLQDDAFFGKAPWPFADTPEAGYPLLLHHHPLTIYRHCVAKQADAVLAVALMPDFFAPDLRQRMVEAYEAVTVHDSTLSASAFATAAARAGDGARAVDYWRVAALTDLCDLFGNSDHGLHMAALAGGWSAVAMGFAGMRVEGDAIVFDPLPLPELGPYYFSIRFRGSGVRVAIDGASVTYTLVDGAPVLLRHGNESAMLLKDCATYGAGA